MATGVITGSTNAVVRNKSIGSYLKKIVQPVSINGIEFDALISEDRELTANIPEYSVEDGYSVSDSIIVSPEALSMTLIVTGTPVTWADRHSEANHLEDTLKALEELFYSRALCTISTREQTYKNMAIESLTLSKNLESGNSREIPISFKKVNVTSINTTTYPATYGKSGGTGASAGSANTKNGSANTNGDKSSESGNKGSILYNGWKWLSDKVG